MSSSRFEQELQARCTANTMCGYSLNKAIYIIGWTSVAMSAASLISCITYLYVQKNRETPDSVWGIMTIAAMTILSLSAYQIVISVLLLWQRMKKRPKFFFYTMWYVSHLSLVTMYCIIFVAIVVIHINNGRYVWGILFFVCCSAYIGILIYFEIIMNSYLNTVAFEERYV